MTATKTITAKAESISIVEYEFEVPADATDEQILALIDNVDGGDFYEVGTEWSKQGYDVQDGDPS